MKFKVEFTHSELLKIAKEVHDYISDVSCKFSVTVKLDGIEVELNIDYEVEYKEVIGGSYEDYDFEKLMEIDNEYYNIDDIHFYDSNGKEIHFYNNDGIELPIIVDINQIEDIL